MRAQGLNHLTPRAPARRVFYLKSCQGFPAWKDSQPVKFWCCRPFGKSSVCQGETDPPELVQWRAALANSDDPDERARKFLPLKCYEVSSVPADQAVRVAQALKATQPPCAP